MGKGRKPLWAAALLDSDLSYVERVVLAYLAWRQGRNDSAWPSLTTIAADLGLTPDGVRRITRRLEKKGRLTIVHPSGQGRGHHLRYVVKGSPVSTLSEEKGYITVDPSESKKGRQRDGERVDSQPEKGRQPSTLTLQEHNKEHTNGVCDTRNGFDCFWDAYPRKENRNAALTAWKRLNPDNTLQTAILDAIRRQSASDAWNRENGRYVPYPAKWLGYERWTDTEQVSRDDPKWLPNADEARETLRQCGIEV